LRDSDHVKRIKYQAGFPRGLPPSSRFFKQRKSSVGLIRTVEIHAALKQVSDSPRRISVLEHLLDTIERRMRRSKFFFIC